MEHYLDNSATTKPSTAALDAMNRAAEIWGNPSSVHGLGQKAAILLRDSRAAVAKALGMPKFGADKLIFTSCGTESNNIAMTGTAFSKKRNPNNPGTIVISAGEHPSISGPAAFLQNFGYDVVTVPTEEGILDAEYLRAALCEVKSPVIFAAFMLVNNETGALYDVKSAAAAVKAKFPDATVHCDAVQSFLKTTATPYSLGVDTMSVSAHKIHSIRGAGALFISGNVIKRKNITAVMPGGGQENAIRSGTENLISIAAFAAAAEEGRENLSSNTEKTAGLRAMFERELSEKLAPLGYSINKPAGKYLANIISVNLPDIRSETMLNYLSGRDIYVSAGSACAANSKKKSAALEAFGLPESKADSVIRVSLSHMNTEDDISALTDALADGAKTLQRKR